MNRVNSNKRKILLVARWPVGGIRTYIKYVFSQPEFADAELTVIAPDVGGLGAQFGPVFPTGLFRYVPCGNSVRQLFNAIVGVLRREHFDVINVQGFTSAMTALLPCLLLAPSTLRLLTVHDVLHPWHFSGWRGRLKRWLMAQALRRYHCIIPVSEDCRNNMLSFLPETRNTRITTILNGVSVDRLVASEALPLRAQLGVDEQPLLVGFMGRFMNQKGFRYLVDAVELMVRGQAAARLPLVICYGSGGFYREEQAAIASRGLADYFRFFDHIEDVGAAMKALDVVVMPSLWEACPLLPMEVLICGTPLIASDCIGLREVVADTPAWVVPAANGTALAEALCQVAVEPRRSLFADYAATAAYRFDVATTRAALARLYNELLDTHH